MLLFLVALVAVCLPTSGMARAASLTDAVWPLYTPGSSGENVRTIQYLLKGQGLILEANGSYDKATSAALKDFQRKNGLRVDGRVGALTWSKLVKASKRGDQGYAIMALQRQLNKSGFQLNDDGIFGPEMEKVVRSYQQRIGLSVDGVAGVRTWKSLLVTTAASEKGEQVNTNSTTTTGQSSSKGKYTTNSQHGVYGLDQKPSISAAFIDSVLAYYRSPAQGMGQKVYDYGVKYGIDPAFALAFFGHESSFGLYGVAVETHSLGNIRCTAGYRCLDTVGNGSFRKYATWSEGIEDWYRLIREMYLDQNRLYTVSQIIPVYAPQADHNNERAYIDYVEEHVQIWRDGQIYA